jgi:hypothetical protein
MMNTMLDYGWKSSDMTIRKKWKPMPKDPMLIPCAEPEVLKKLPKYPPGDKRNDDRQMPETD